MDFLQFLAGFRTPALNVFFQAVTSLAQQFFIVGIICWLYWCSDKKLGRTLGFSFFISGLLVQALKITFHIARPWILDPTFVPVASALAGATGYSFPSGHTQSITSLFGVLALHTRRRISKVACFIVIALVGFSRMYLGVHTPKDVLTAFVLSLLIAIAGYHIFYKKEFSQKTLLPLSVLLIGCSLLLALYAYLRYRSSVIELVYIGDCFKAAGAGAAFGIGYYVEERWIQFRIPSDLKTKILRFMIGVVITVILLQGTKRLLGTSLAASFTRYFLSVLWVLVFYPLLMKRTHLFTREPAR